MSHSSDTPYIVDVEAGKSYMWCSCKLSKRQPFCDGSHSSTDARPVMYNATETKKVFFCGCKKTSNQPICDGSHNAL